MLFLESKNGAIKMLAVCEDWQKSDALAADWRQTTAAAHGMTKAEFMAKSFVFSK